MYYFEAIVRPQFAERLCQDLIAWSGISDLSATEIIGSGRRFIEGDIGGYAIDMLPKVLVAGCVVDEEREDLIDVICTDARTGRVGDGKIFLYRIVGEA